MFVNVKVFAGARKEKLIVSSEVDGLFEVYVREPAQKNLANVRVRELIAKHFDVLLKDVQILTGFHSPKKRLTVKM